MDIRNWPFDRIMQLPDCCFGRKWPLIFCHNVNQLDTERSIHPIALPERCVIWEVGWWGFVPAEANCYVEFALGDIEPTTNVIFDTFESFLPSIAGDRSFGIGAECVLNTQVRIPMRMPIQSAGRRVAVRFTNLHAEAAGGFNAVVIVSSIPREVPDCLLSARG